MTTPKTTRALPEFFIGSQLASERIATFQASKHPALSKTLGKDDTKAIWYSARHIEELFKELIFLNADGLRIYFGEYGANHQLYPGQLCLIMVPTRLDAETQSHVDILLDKEDDFEKRPGHEKFVANAEKKHDITNQEKGYNYGSPCPPVCPGQVMKYPL